MNIDLAKRVVRPEMLDALSPTDARAIASRRDLQRLNFLMGHVPAMRRTLLAEFPHHPPTRIIELGAGDGTFMLRLAETLSHRWPKVEVTLVDRHPSISPQTKAGFQKLGWDLNIAAANVFDWLPNPVTHSPAHPPSALLANLFLHHFEPNSLTRLLTLAAARCRLMVACEPRRAWPGLCMTRLFWIMGCHPVTSHDAAISVRAGFKSLELSRQWPVPGWRLQETRAGLFSHLFVASKPTPQP